MTENLFTIAPAADESIIRNARHNAQIGWIRLPITCVLSGFLFVFVGPFAGWTWLSATVAIEFVAVAIRRRVIAGDNRFASAHLAAVFLISLAWVGHAILLWRTEIEAARISALVDLFSVALYGVIGGYKSPKLLVAPVAPALTTLFVLLTSLGWSTLPPLAAVLTTLGSAGACATIIVSAYALYKSDHNLNAANRELQALSLRLKAMAEAERGANRAKDTFLATVSHEMRTPLNGIVGMAGSLDLSQVGETERPKLEVIRSSGEALERLISDLLDVSAIEAGRLDLRVRKFEATQLASWAVSVMTPLAVSRNLSLEMECSPAAAAAFEGDDLRIGQIILNLVSNALKYTERGRVRLELDAAEGSPGQQTALRIVVSDTGIGFDPAQTDLLFKRFERGEAAKDGAANGLGLGLTIARSLAEAMGGAISASSTPGSGSRFEVVLPLRRATSPDAAHAEARTQASGDGLRSGDRRISVLLAEDHPANQKVVAAMLGPLGVSLTVVSNGKAALEAVTASLFDVIIMDMLMPGMGGLEATRAIRALERERRTARTPIVMLTASVLPGQVEQAFAAGCDVHLSKPITPLRLIEAINQALALTTEWENRLPA